MNVNDKGVLGQIKVIEDLTNRGLILIYTEICQSGLLWQFAKLLTDESWSRGSNPRISAQE